MFAIQGNDKFTKITMLVGLLCGSTAVAHGLLTMDIPRIGIGLAFVAIFSFVLHKVIQGRHVFGENNHE